MGTVVSVVAFIAVGALLLLALDLIDSLVDKTVRRFRPRRTAQHYPGGPYLSASSGAPDPMFH